ncbi:hypothetical protein C2845_PM03G33900 [Panicum miliaceum]|uniref:Uncharacterized protein n=1 Tax=Panicum miliaceum TaxID=4540 RepID=A0A3L6TB69_PANMI|nr:hypothetical protein C2845_PM03G33900 [Panicum miliaceum]
MEWIDEQQTEMKAMRNEARSDGLSAPPLLHLAPALPLRALGLLRLLLALRAAPAALPRAFWNIDVVSRPTAGTPMGSSGLAGTLRVAARCSGWMRSGTGCPSSPGSPDAAKEPHLSTKASASGHRKMSLLVNLFYLMMVKHIQDESDGSDDELEMAAVLIAEMEEMESNKQPKHGGSVQGHEVVRQNKQQGHKLFSYYFANDLVFGPMISAYVRPLFQLVLLNSIVTDGQDIVI